MTPSSPRIALFPLVVAWCCWAGPASAADWPPTLDPKNPDTQSVTGRVIERYTHGPREEWGYPASAAAEWAYPEPRGSGKTRQDHCSFYLVAPKNPRTNVPLCVVLHSANRTAYDYLGFGHLNRKIDRSDDPATTMTNSPEDFYALYLSSTNAEWWGWGHIRKDPKRPFGPAPAERRILDTIEWVVNRCNIDRNRIYLCGVSMGGCGTLGIGLPHGELFAAIRPDVPAGTEYAAYRMGGFPATPPAVSPPVLVDFSSQIDNWAKTQPRLVQAAQDAKLGLVLCWAPFGHTTFANRIAKYPIGQVALAFPWLEIRKNEAYPVFTHASCDQRSPWLGAAEKFDESGQMNAWFRWTAKADTPDRIAMSLWIEHPMVANPPPDMPESATADVTFRRLQQPAIPAGKAYHWQMVQDRKGIAQGTVIADAAGLLTVPKVQLSVVQADLVLTPEKR